MPTSFALEGSYIRTTLSRMYDKLNVIRPAIREGLAITHCPGANKDLHRLQEIEIAGVAALAVMIESLHRGQRMQCRMTHKSFATPGLLLTHPAANGPNGSFIEALLLPTMTGGLVASVHCRKPGLIGDKLFSTLTDRVICSYRFFHIARSSRGGLQPDT